MILTIIIIIALLLAYRSGMRRGLVAIVVRTIGFLVVAGLGIFLAPSVGQMLSNIFPTTVSQVFYQMLAFWVIAILGGIGLRIITNAASLTTKKVPVISQVDGFLGGMVALLLMYGVLFFGLLLVSAWPSESTQVLLDNSSVAQFILNKTPLISEQVYNNWLNGSQTTIFG